MIKKICAVFGKSEIEFRTGIGSDELLEGLLGLVRQKYEKLSAAGGSMAKAKAATLLADKIEEA